MASTAVSPDLTIRRFDNGSALRLSSTRLGRESLTLRLAAPDVVRTRRSRFALELRRFRQRVGDSLTRTPQVAAEALAELASAGRVFLVSTLASVDDVERLTEYVRRACPTWTVRPARPPWIQAVAPIAEHLPWELLPIFDLRASFVASTTAQLLDTSRTFAGFGALVEHRLPVRVNGSSTADVGDALGVRFFYHAGYDGAHAELGFLRAQAGRVRLRGPYPNGGATPSFGRQLRDPTLNDDGTTGGPPDHVVHFACHCDTLGEDVDDYAFHLADESGAVTRLTVATLFDEIVRAAPTRSGNNVLRLPFVLINACDSALLDARSGAGLITPFERNGNPALIGTAASVSDDVAARFSARFYARILSGDNLAAAVHNARVHLLLHHGNPLGVLYCTFGDAELRLAPVREPIDSSAGGRL